MAFFESPVFYTLLAMGVVLIPALYYPLHAWSRDGAFAQPNGAKEKGAWMAVIVRNVVLGYAVVVIGFLGIPTS